MEQQHAIGKLSLELQLASGQDAFSLQSRLSTRCTTELAPLLAELLDTWTGPGELLQIDKLEIDLGICTPETLERELSQLVIAFLKKRFPGMRQQTMLEEGMSRITLGQGYFGSWLYFLEHGILPHTAASWSRQDWEAGVLETLAAESAAYQQCFELLSEKPVALERLLLQFSAEFVQKWLQAFSGSTYQVLLQLLTEWESFCYHPQPTSALSDQPALLMPVLPAGPDFHFALMHYLIKNVVLAKRQTEDVVFLEELMALQVLPVAYWLYIFKQSPPELKHSLPLLQTAALKLTASHVAALAVIENEVSLKGAQIAMKEALKSASGSAKVNADQISPSATSNAVTSKTVESSKVARDEVPAADAVAASAFSNVEAVTSEKNEDVIDSIPEGTTLYINNAGLILLHPYLGILFDALDLRDKDCFKDLHKAIQLLGYLASGEDDIPEYDLVLPKLLCGIAPSQPVKRFVPLTEAEKKEADDLLLAVIEHWNALGSTTADGLRGNFLMREGKLEWKEEEWQLYVTQQPYDMLLNRLPWGYSVVGFSWMPWLIKTVWT